MPSSPILGGCPVLMLRQSSLVLQHTIGVERLLNPPIVILCQGLVAGCTPGVCFRHLTVLQNRTEPQVHRSAISLLSLPLHRVLQKVSPMEFHKVAGGDLVNHVAGDWQGWTRGRVPSKAGVSESNRCVSSRYLLWSSSSLSQLGRGWPILYSSLESSMLCSW